jgi:hypothetical protein
MPPPSLASLPDGATIELHPLAQRIADAHLGRHPEDVERYGDELARAWCTHDHQHILAWAAGDLDLDGQLAWLARLLDARGYPVANLLDSVSTAADTLERALDTDAAREVSARLRAAAGKLAAAPD